MLKLNKKMNKLGAYATASVITGLMSVGTANATPAPAPAGNSFNSISQNVTNQIGTLPGFITALAYILGTLFAVLGLLKIKDHVENPSNAPLKDGLIRLAIGGALFVVPLITEAMQNLVGQGGAGVNAQKMKSIANYNAIAP
jgi:hypothetical protein